MNQRNHTARIEYMMTSNQWTIDRTAFELNCMTPDLRWFIAGHPAESDRQQIRLDAIVASLDAHERNTRLNDAQRPILMRAADRDRLRGRSATCKNGHTYIPGSYTLDKNGRRMCLHCMESRNPLRYENLAAFRSALGTLNGRGLRDIEVAGITGISKASISDYRRGGVGVTVDRLRSLEVLVAVTNDLTGHERPRTRQYGPHPMIDEITTRYLDQRLKVAA